ncbi:MAG: hypothetical protein WCL07_03480, partial [bacterium]
ENDTMTKSIDDSSDFFPNITVKDIFLRNFHFDCNGFMHTSKIIEEGVRWDENLSLLEDWDFVMTIAKKYPDNFFYIAKILFNYHQRFGTDGLVSNANYLDWANAFEYIYQKHKNDLLLMGQEWYPARVIKYRQLETDFKSNIAPKPYLKYFVT